MIIFGTKTRTALVAAMFALCHFCNAPAAQRLFELRRWFTLFFIPVFPFGKVRYVCQCAYCGNQSQLTPEAARQFHAAAGAAEAGRVGRGTIGPLDPGRG